MINVGENVEKREPLYTVRGNVNQCSHYGKEYGGSSRNKNKTTIWSIIPTSTYIYIYEGNKVTMLSEIRQILHDIIYMWNIKKTH